MKVITSVYAGHTYTHIPPLSVIGGNTSLLPLEDQPPQGTPTPGHGDLVVPNFRYEVTCIFSVQRHVLLVGAAAKSIESPAHCSHGTQ